MNKIFFILFLFSITLCNSDVLWDFGVKINPLENSDSKQQLNPDELKLHAIISDPFVSPILNTQLNKPDTQTNDEILNNIYNQNISNILRETQILYFKKKYNLVIQILQNINAKLITDEVKYDIDFLLADALYQTGEFQLAIKKAENILQYNSEDKIYFLLMIIYQSIGEKNKSIKFLNKLMNEFPYSDYITSANIKANTLN
tara:strand:- start:1432 stop:2037 length:606 start_codon:yes stop_codon:yes gene_type:complete